jgi:phosphate-selective porin OprO and OprP
MRFLLSVLGRSAPAVAILIAFGPLAGLIQGQEPATPDLERRVRELEQTIQTLHAGRAAQPDALPSSGTGTGGPSSLEGGGPPRGTAELGRVPTGPPGIDLTRPGESVPFFAGWDNGFFLRSPDGNFNLRLTGQIQADNRSYLDSNDTTNVDTFLLRRARLGIEADVFKYYEFRLLPDFGQSQPRITDAYINIHYIDAIQFEAGKFKQPFSYEQLIQDRYVPVAERSLIDQLVPQRDEGVMVHGQNLLAGRLDYAAAVFNGEINGEQDTNNAKDLAARIAVRPFFDRDRPGTTPLGHLQFGFAFTTGIEQETVSPNPLRTPSQIAWFTFNTGVRANGVRNRYSPEVSYFYGPFGFAAQYFREDQALSSTASTRAVPRVGAHYEGGYVLATLLLTGEERTTYSQLIRPLRPFDPSSPFANPGAWELVGRASQLRIDSAVFNAGAANLATRTGNSPDASEVTVGFNWYLNAYVRMQFNYEHSWFGNPIRIGTGTSGLVSREDALITRLQLIW